MTPRSPYRVAPPRPRDRWRLPRLHRGHVGVGLLALAMLWSCLGWPYLAHIGYASHARYAGALALFALLWVAGVRLLFSRYGEP